MYPQCRHVRPSSDRCRAAAVKGGHWCYYHARLHSQQAHRKTEESARRSREARSKPRLADGTFAPQEVLVTGAHHCENAPAAAGAWGTAEANQLHLPDVEDSASIQLALIEVIQALATNQLDPRRAGLLLYGLQVASANAKKVHIHANSIRSLSYTSEGIPLATQEHGWDVEDIEEADREAEEEEEEE
jgi:hypothetical protein